MSHKFGSEYDELISRARLGSEYDNQRSEIAEERLLVPSQKYPKRKKHNANAKELSVAEDPLEGAILWPKQTKRSEQKSAECGELNLNRSLELEAKERTREENLTETVEPFLLRGDCGTPISYDDIEPWRDIVFLARNLPYAEKEQSGGAPISGTLYYIGYIRGKKGPAFAMTIFSTMVADGHVKPIEGTKVLRDGGVHSQPMIYDETKMKFWRTGEQTTRL